MSVRGRTDFASVYDAIEIHHVEAFVARWACPTCDFTVRHIHHGPSIENGQEWSLARSSVFRGAVNHMDEHEEQDRRHARRMRRLSKIAAFLGMPRLASSLAEASNRQEGK